MTDWTRIDAIVTAQAIHTDWTRIDRIVDNMPARPVTTGYDGRELKVGHRVELDRAGDKDKAFMRGARYGTIVKIWEQTFDPPLVAVQLDQQPDGARMIFHADRMRAI